jgi:hypothetical protein
MAGFFKRNAWLIPLIFALALGVAGWTSYRALAAQMMQDIASLLETIRNAEVAALDMWAVETQAVARGQAADPRVRAAIEDLRAVSTRTGGARDALLSAPTQAVVRHLLRELLERHGFSGFAAMDVSGLYLAGDREDLVGTRPRVLRVVLDRVLEGETVMTRPLRWEGAAGGDQAIILVASPVPDAGGAITAILGLAVPPEREFKRLLAIARPGTSGETYAFDDQGVLVSPSRFETQLREIGLLPAGAGSFMNIEVRDPGGNLVEGFVPKLPLKVRALTRAAADAVSGGTGVDVAGYRDYRGVPVAGAWSWIPALRIGIATEIDIDEAYQGLYLLRRRFGVVTGLLVVAALGMFLYSFVIVRLSHAVDEARKVGRYSMSRKLGSGGMGTVYLASHALLRRPTAIKILKAESAGKEGVARFEREVQVTSSLSHPNTIEIYDFGYTPDGTFYYAMEYLDGVTIGRCVEGDGAQPEARVVHVMRQVCASIAEAHGAGLVHRDLKPSNIMLCERGGLYDFVKVLDFGLVRPVQQSAELALTALDSLTGTPLYVPPEAIRAPDTLDARADVYQLGQILYYLLVGRHVFQGDSAYDVLAQHVGTAPVPPSTVLGRSVAPELEKLILWCLEKKPDDRPRDAAALLDALERCPVDGAWSQREARTWWASWWERNPRVVEPTPSTGGTPSGYTIDLARRVSRAWRTARE